MWRLDNKLLNNQCVKEVKKYLDIKWNYKTEGMHQKTVLRGKFLVIDVK